MLSAKKNAVHQKEDEPYTGSATLADGSSV